MGGLVPRSRGASCEPRILFTVLTPQTPAWTPPEPLREDKLDRRTFLVLEVPDEAQGGPPQVPHRDTLWKMDRVRSPSQDSHGQTTGVRGLEAWRSWDS